MKLIGAVVGLTLAAIVATLSLARDDHAEWRRYVVEHNCQRIATDVSIPFAPVAQWSCDNGVQVESRADPIQKH